jgi:hypothetical protein
MKTKFLLLHLVIAGIIMISGCVDMRNQSLTYKAPGNLYRNIFHPYAGLFDHGSLQSSDMPPPNLLPPGSRAVSNNILRDATTLLDRNIEKAGIVSMRLEAGIQRQKAEGKNVSRLESLLEKYNLSIKLRTATLP